MSTKCIVVTNQKGGSGKTTTSINLSAGLAEKGFDVLCVDIDPQQSAFFWWESSFDTKEELAVALDPTTQDPALKVSKQLPFQVVSVITDAPDIFMEKLVELNNQRARVIGKPFDYIVVDTPPNPANAILNAALYVSDLVLVPTVPDVLHLDAMRVLLEVCSVANETRLNHQRRPIQLKIVPNRVVARSADQFIISTLTSSVALWKDARGLDVSVTKATISSRAAINHSCNARRSIFSYGRNHELQESYLKLIEELV